MYFKLVKNTYVFFLKNKKHQDVLYIPVNTSGF